MHLYFLYIYSVAFTYYKNQIKPYSTVTEMKQPETGFTEKQATK